MVTRSPERIVLTIPLPDGSAPETFAAGEEPQADKAKAPNSEKATKTFI